jgi:alpha-2-macroglobulin
MRQTRRAPGTGTGAPRAPRRGAALRWLTIAVVMLLVASACSSSDDSEPTAQSTPDPGEATMTDTGDEGDGRTLSVSLSAGQAVGGSQGDETSTPVVEGSPLGPRRVDAVLERLGDWDVPDETTDFNRPAETLPPPIVGETIDEPFPVPEPAPVEEVPTGALEVLRFQPEGEVAIAPSLSVTFSQPMVPLGTLEQLDAADVPVTLTPDVPGRWQWIGTRTLRFEADSDTVDRLPMATEFTATIPAGTASAKGWLLSETVEWTFATPPVQVQGIAPGDGPIPLDQVFYVGFDQRVDADAALGAVSLTEDGDAVAIRLATDAEIAADDQISDLVAQSLDDRWIAFRAVDELATETRYRIEVQGVPSAEGPRTSDAVAVETVNTYAPLRIVRSECGYGGPCEPLSPWSIVLNNPIDPDAFDPSMVTVSPELPGQRVQAFGDTIQITGASAGQTDYEVTVDASLTDVFGQTLGGDETVTIAVGDARPQLFGTDRPFVTLDPLSRSQEFSFTSINHDAVHVRVFRVTPEEWGRFPNYIWDSERFLDDDGRIEAPDTWELALDEAIETDGDTNTISETLVDLRPVLLGGPGQLVVIVEPTEQYSRNDDLYWQNRPLVTWVQSTVIGIDAVADDRSVVVRATDLRDGSPIGGLDVAISDSDVVIITGSDGVGTGELPTTGGFEGFGRVLVAQAGDDIAMLPSLFSGNGWQGSERSSDQTRWYLLTDRGVYRPGETVSLKGWVRRLTTTGEGRLELLDVTDQTPRVLWTARDAQGNEIADGAIDVNALGGFDTTFELPVAANLGPAYLDLRLRGVDDMRGQGWGHQFLVDEFRRPEFEVVTRPETPGPYLRTLPATVAADATYFAGGALPDAEVKWQVTTNKTAYAPPGWDDYSFGIWVPWWFDGGGFEGDFARSGASFEEDCCFPGQEPVSVETFTGRTDVSGSHYLQIDFDGPAVDEPTTVSAQATVFDVNRQGFASRTDLLVHAADRYVGLRSDRVFVRAGDPLTIEAIVTDIDGAAVEAAGLRIEAGRLEWGYTDGEWAEELVDVETCTATAGATATDPVTCEFATPVGGQYRITAVVTDAEGRTNRSELTRWVAGGDAVPTRNVELESLTLVPDTETYEPGTTAEILVSSPFAAGEGLVTIARNGIERTQTFTVVDNAAVVEIPIAEDDIPLVSIQVDVVGITERTADDGTPVPDAPPRPAFATGRLDLAVSAAARTLDVAVAPAAEAVEPGSATEVDVTVTDAAGEPVEGAELAVIVVDEAVLSLTGYELADPIEAFYQPFGTWLATEYARSSIVLADPLRLVAGDDDAVATDYAAAGDGGGEELAQVGDAEEAASDEGGGAFAASEAAPDADRALAAGQVGPDGTPITVRTDFDALATFVPDATTDADGTVRIEVDLPDNLTRYRVMVVAVDGADRFGSGESNITARLPLMVRPSAPRFLNFGDTFELPVVVQNQTDAEVTVDLAIEASNLDLTDGRGRTVTVPANDRVEVRFPAAAVEAGTARFRVAGVTDDGSPNGAADAATIALPVYTPATAEAFATYGDLTEGAVLQPLLQPEGVFPQFGGLEVTTSSTALATLTDAVLYLHDYRYDSADAYASRIIAVASLRDILSAFAADGLPPAAELNTRVASDIAELVKLQNFDGGFTTWQFGRPSDPYVSVQATHALVLAGGEGYEVPEQSLRNALRYLENIPFPPGWDRPARNTVKAYALHVRDLAGRSDPDAAAALYDEFGPGGADELGLDAIAWLWPVLDDRFDDEIETLFVNRATETASAATFTTDYGEQAYLLLHSDRRTDGIILDALLTRRPDSDLIVKVVNGLIANQKRGRWENIQENSFILVAMKRYFEARENVEPDFVARVWLGDLYAAEHEYSGRSTDSRETLVPMGELLLRGDTDLVVANDGAGRLYYRLGLRYAPDDLVLDPLDRGFVVERRYEAVDDPGDVVLDDDGVWRIRAGATVRVTLSMVADSRRTNMALVDPLPAGFETQSTALVTTPEVPPPSFDDEGFEGEGVAAVDEGFAGDFSPIWWGPWWDHQNSRDDRTEAFAGFLPAGDYTYSYLARATTPGTFVVPPAKAEEIYTPETFGRSASATVIIEG